MVIVVAGHMGRVPIFDLLSGHVPDAGGLSVRILGALYLDSNPQEIP